MKLLRQIPGAPYRLCFSDDFFSLSVDEVKAKDLLLFRLAENVTAVLVHEQVKSAVEASGITNLTWFKSESWAG